jgi:hypothetical protein
MKKLYISESERYDILRKHNSRTVFLEQNQPAQQNYTIQDIQNKLLSLGYGVGDTGADNKFGNNTLTAIEKALGSIGGTQNVQTNSSGGKSMTGGGSLSSIKNSGRLGGGKNQPESETTKELSANKLDTKTTTGLNTTNGSVTSVQTTIQPGGKPADATLSNKT